MDINHNLASKSAPRAETRGIPITDRHQDDTERCPLNSFDSLHINFYHIRDLTSNFISAEYQLFLSRLHLSFPHWDSGVWDYWQQSVFCSFLSLFSISIQNWLLPLLYTVISLLCHNLDSSEFSIAWLRPNCFVSIKMCAVVSHA